VVAAVCGVALSTVAVPRFAGSLLRAPGSQAVELAATGRALRDESYARSVKSARWAAAWRQERRDLVELGLVHFNRGSRAPAGSTEQAGYYAQSLAALHESLKLSPVQPVAWLLVAGIHYELGERQAAGNALEWAVRTGRHLPSQHRTRAIIGIAVWDMVDAATRLELLTSVRQTLGREADLMAWAALAAAMEDRLESCIRLLQPDGSDLADRFRLAVENERQSRGIEAPPANGRADCQLQGAQPTGSARQAQRDAAAAGGR
jgi:tetratricopeptide (TPR) repeat protein